jgi:hypothetical protein
MLHFIVDRNAHNISGLKYDSLDLDNALTSLLTIKMSIPEPCHKYEPPEKVIKKIKDGNI